jgi:hypothetical protein
MTNYDINYRLDMCRRQYANDACNRGTAGKVLNHQNHTRFYLILSVKTQN